MSARFCLIRLTNPSSDMLVVIVSPWSLGAGDRRRQSANDTRIGRARHHNVTLMRDIARTAS
jgi:hypothetical protein